MEQVGLPLILLGAHSIKLAEVQPRRTHERDLYRFQKIADDDNSSRLKHAPDVHTANVGAIYGGRRLVQIKTTIFCTNIPNEMCFATTSSDGNGAQHSGKFECFEHLPRDGGNQPEVPATAQQDPRQNLVLQGRVVKGKMGDDLQIPISAIMPQCADLQYLPVER